MILGTWRFSDLWRFLETIEVKQQKAQERKKERKKRKDGGWAFA